ncbi:hypothetical protein HMPREF1043_1038 [Streptococcus anginosus subsp. whileyi CCUG 39159]|uniref:Uncharacterized protein n=1 Tax=Streptococcus anginosus subsp. whileyi CCUG 39159 TaxID=1095729 RepID=I0SCM7_STRAP|nr:hypothetical protein HMPREF1043_1038 [Streptococcus anginosus subsp. whileyi CCUG 39159]
MLWRIGEKNFFEIRENIFRNSIIFTNKFLDFAKILFVKSCLYPLKSQ